MASFEEDIQFAMQTLRVRDALINKEFTFEKHNVKYTVQNNMATIWLCKTRNGVYNPVNIAELGASADMDLFSKKCYINKSSLIIYNNVTDILLHDDDVVDECYNVISAHTHYDESLHFQHSLIYNPDTLLRLVTASVLLENPTKEQTRFSIFWKHIPTLYTLLGGGDFQ